MLLKFKFISDVNAEDVNMEKQCVVCFLNFYLELILTGSIRKKMILFWKVGEVIISRTVHREGSVMSTGLIRLREGEMIFAPD